MGISRTKKIYVIEPSNEGSGQIIATALKGAAGDYEIVTLVGKVDPDQLKQEHPYITFVVLADHQLSRIGRRGFNDLKPCPTIELMWNLVEADELLVHALIPNERLLASSDKFTPLDTLALSRSGIAGIWEVGARLMVEPKLRTIVEQAGFFWRTRNTYLYGRPAEDLFNFIEEVANPSWPTTIETDQGEEDNVLPAYVRYSFDAAHALAQLSIEEYTMPEGSNNSLLSYANRLLGFSNRTGLVMAPGMLMRALGYLHRRWSDRVPNYSGKRKNEMPELARKEQFPEHAICLRGFEPHDVNKELFNAAQKIEFDRDWRPNASMDVTFKI
jgi:hypothetical protein